MIRSSAYALVLFALLAAIFSPSVSATAQEQKWTIYVPPTPEKINVPPHTQQEDKPVDWVARMLGAGSFMVSIFGLCLTWYNSRKARERSIEDEFWFRKILTPSTIEPILKTVTDLLGGLPSPTSDIAAQREFALRVTTDFQRINASAEPLAMLDPGLPNQVRNDLLNCEDCVSEYCQQLATHPQSANPAAVRADAWHHICSAMNAVRLWQKAH